MPKRPPRLPAYPTLPLSGHHVRLLRVQPGERDDIITCETKVVNLRDSPDYYGLSYMCGSMDHTQLIELNGNRVRVRKNLWDFIVELRARHMSYSVSASSNGSMTAILWPWLWCDMICVDQEHLVERSRQVQMMDQIYANAQSVWAWVGYLREKPDSWLLPCDFVRSASAYLAPYWNRCWIVQEVVSARRIIVHANAETWDITTMLYDPRYSVFRKAIRIRENREVKPAGMNVLHQLSELQDSEPKSSAFKKLIGTRDGYEVNPAGMNLIHLLSEFQDSECSDPRDKVFALVKISKEHREGRKLIISYSKTVTQVFFETLVFMEPTALRMLPDACSLAKALELDFDTLWRFTTLQSNYLKSDIADGVTFLVELPVIGEIPSQSVLWLLRAVVQPVLAPTGDLRRQACCDEALPSYTGLQLDAGKYLATRALGSDIVIIVEFRPGEQLMNMFKVTLVCTSENLDRRPDFKETELGNSVEVRLTKRQLLLAMNTP